MLKLRITMATKKTAKYKKLTVKGGKKNIDLYVGPKVHNSWKEISQQLDVYAFGHLINLLEAAQEQGKRLGRAEVIEGVLGIGKQIGKQIDALERTTGYKGPGRPKKKP
jgi:hypothetical protein